jgi:hypothetical protein
VLRNIILLLISVLGLFIVRNIAKEIGRAVSRAMNGASPSSQKTTGSKQNNSQRSGKLVQDPQTGTYIDPAHAVRTKVDDKIQYFESVASRDEYMKTRA